MNPDVHLSTDRVRGLLAAAVDVRVLVVGDCMLDRYVKGSADRVSPEAPVPIVRVAGEERRPGGAANVARAAAALGARVRLAGVIGGDAEGGVLRELLGEAGVDDADLLVDPDRPTTTKTRILARGQQLLRIDREVEAPLPSDLREELEARASVALGDVDALVLADYEKGTLGPETGGHLLTAAGKGGVPSVVDPKRRHFFRLRGATVFKPNGRELAAALGREDPPRTEEALRSVRRRLECRALLVTLGPAGMLLVEEGRPGASRIPAWAREVYDVTGAGDTVTCALAVFLAAGASLQEAARLANLAAGVQVGRLGAVPISRTELERAVEGGVEPEEGSP